MIAAMRPEILYPLFAPIDTLKGVGPRVAPLLSKLAGPVVRDVAFLTPHSLIHRQPARVEAAVEGAVQTFVVTIEAYQAPRNPSQPWRVRAFDGTGSLTLVYFGGLGGRIEGQNPVGAQRLVSGKVERFGSEIQIAHPDYLVPVEKADQIPEVEAVYPATAGLPARTVRRLALDALGRCPDLAEWQDPAWLRPWPPPCPSSSPAPSPAPWPTFAPIWRAASACHVCCRGMLGPARLSWPCLPWPTSLRRGARAP